MDQVEALRSSGSFETFDTLSDHTHEMNVSKHVTKTKLSLRRHTLHSHQEFLTPQPQSHMFQVILVVCLSLWFGLSDVRRLTVGLTPRKTRTHGHITHRTHKRTWARPRLPTQEGSCVLGDETLQDGCLWDEVCDGVTSGVCVL